MRVWYDWEFLEDGRTIDPISIGMVAEDGREYYAVFQNIMSGPLYSRICRHSWLMENVVRQLPLVPNSYKLPTFRYAGSYRIDRMNPAVKTKPIIRSEIRQFLAAAVPTELWGYYAAYDHVCLAQLFGPMVDCPDAMPMVTFDIVQLCATLGRSESSLPKDPQNVHNALADARWHRDAYRALIGPSAPG